MVQKEVLGTGIVKVLVPGIFRFFSGGIGTGSGKIWYRKKVTKLVSVKFGIVKSLGTGIGKKLVPKKVSVSVSNKFVSGTVIGIV